MKTTTSTANHTQVDLDEFVREHVIACDISYRGGTLKVDASELFPTLPSGDAVVGAIQNYLGGGIAGAIEGVAMCHPSDIPAIDRVHFHPLLEACKRHFHQLNNGGGDSHMQENYSSYEFNQTLPESGY